MSLYQKLYPNLNFNQVRPPSSGTLQVSGASKNVRSSSAPHESKIHSLSKVGHPEQVVRESSPVKEVIPEPIVATITHKEEVIEKKVHKPKRKVVIKEEISHNVDSPVPTIVATEVVKPKAKRPNRVKPEPKPETIRTTTIPKKGEQGLQPKYSFEQKKSIYLDKLSRKSCKNAEKEISKVNEILEKVGHDPSQLKMVEREMKSKLKLINSAKFFADQKKPPVVSETILPIPTPQAPSTMPLAVPEKSLSEPSVEPVIMAQEQESESDSDASYTSNDSN